MRIVFVHHATFFVNSLAHSFGDKQFSDLHTSYDSVVTAVLSTNEICILDLILKLALGEGYHNFHHEFPQDYRNGIKFYNYDPTKWLISGLAKLGLVYNLKWIPDEEIEKARVQMQERFLAYEKAQIQFGKNYDQLPAMTMAQFTDRSKTEKLIVIGGIVHDITTFVHDHPGNLEIISHILIKKQVEDKPYLITSEVMLQSFLKEQMKNHTNTLKRLINTCLPCVLPRSKTKHDFCI